MIGACASTTVLREYVRGKLNNAWASVDLSDRAEREGWAHGYGLASREHLDLVLDKLKMCADDKARKGASTASSFSKMFGFGSSSSPSSGGGAAAAGPAPPPCRTDHRLCATALAYAQVARLGPRNLLESRLGPHIVAPVADRLLAVKLAEAR